MKIEVPNMSKAVYLPYAVKRLPNSLPNTALQRTAQLSKAEESKNVARKGEVTGREAGREALLNRK